MLGGASAPRTLIKHGVRKRARWVFLTLTLHRKASSSRAPIKRESFESTRQPYTVMTDKIGRRKLIATAAVAGASLTGCIGSSGSQDGDPADGGTDGGTDGGDAGGASETGSLPESGDEQYIQEVKPFESEGREHVEEDVEYKRKPPLSGRHHDGWIEAGFYEERQPAEELVHSLEHGAVVVYYDPNALTGAAESDLRERASTHTGTWTSVIVVPSLRDDPETPYTLTAWRHRLRRSEYDPDAVTAFLAEYLGRGPENPVR